MSLSDVLTVAHKVLHMSFFTGGMGGLLAAASVDYKAFTQWKSFDDARKYTWGIATFRWLQGTIVGAVTAAGINNLL